MVFLQYFGSRRFSALPNIFIHTHEGIIQSNCLATFEISDPTPLPHFEMSPNVPTRIRMSPATFDIGSSSSPHPLPPPIWQQMSPPKMSPPKYSGFSGSSTEANDIPNSKANVSSIWVATFRWRHSGCDIWVAACRIATFGMATFRWRHSLSGNAYCR